MHQLSKISKVYVEILFLVHHQQPQVPQQPPPPYPQSYVQQPPQQNFFDIPQQSGEDDCWNLESITPSLTSSDLDSIMPSLDLLPDVSGSILSDMELMADVEDLVMDDLMSSTTQSVKQSPPSQNPRPTPPLKPPSSAPILKPPIATSQSSHLIPPLPSAPQQQPEVQNDRIQTVPDVSRVETSTVTTTTTTTTSPIATETSNLTVPISSPVSIASPVQSPACDENGIPITYTSKGKFSLCKSLIILFRDFKKITKCYLGINVLRNKSRKLLN